MIQNTDGFQIVDVYKFSRLKYKIHTEWVELIPKWEKQAAEYKKVTLPMIQALIS